MPITYPGSQSGVYIAALTTGVLGATLAADAPIGALRCGPTQTASSIMAGTRLIYVTELGVKVASVVAFTAAQQFGLYLQRFSAANLAGGVAALIGKLSSSTAPNSVALTGGPEGGDTRVSTTAALTTAGVTFDGNKIPIYGWSIVGPADYGYTVVSFADSPIRLLPGEGLSLHNSVLWPAAGTGVVTAYLKFEERIF